MVALGSNLGDRLAHLRGGLAVLAEELTGLRVSPVYETAPVGGPAQGDYLNAVVVAAARADLDLLALAHRAEAARERRRAERWGPRTLDVDVISVDAVISADPALTLPHPRAHERAFVLAPWYDVDPAATLPGLGRVADLLGRVDRTGVHRRDDLRLDLP